MEPNSGQETPAEERKHRSEDNSGAKTQEAVRQLTRQVYEQAEAIKQQNNMLAYLVEAVGKLVDQRSPGAPEHVQRTGIDRGNKTAEDLSADPKTAEDLSADPKTAEDLSADPNTAEDLNADPNTAEDLNADPKTSEDLNADPKAAEDLNADPNSEAEAEGLKL